MRSPLFGIYTGNLDDTNTNYNWLENGSNVAWAFTETDRRKLISVAGTINKLEMTVVNAPGMGKSYTFALMVNGSATALTCQIAGTNVSASDITHSVSVAVGDLVSIRCVPSGTPAASGVSRWTMDFNSTVDGQPLMWANGNSLSSTVVRNCYLTGSDTNGNSDVKQVIPADGTISTMYVSLLQAPNTGKSHILTLYVNGLATALTTTISNAATTGHDTTHSVAVSASDLVYWYSTPSGTPDPSGDVKISCVFTPTIPGASLIMSQGAGGPSAGTTTYNQLAGSNQSATETAMTLYFPADLTVSDFFAEGATAPGSTHSGAFTLRRNALDTAITGTIADLATVTSDTNHSIVTAAGDLLDMKVVMSASATPFGNAGCMRYSVVGNYTPVIPVSFYGKKNNAASTLSVAITTTGQLTLTVQTGDNGKFPDTQFVGTLFPVGATDLSTSEIVLATYSGSGDVFNIIRAQEDTTAQTWPITTTAFQNLITVGQMTQYEDFMEDNMVASGAQVGYDIFQDGAVNTGTTQIPFDNTKPQITEGKQYMTFDYAPSDANNILQVDVTTYAATSALGHMTTALFQDGATNAVATSTNYASNIDGIVINKLTYKVTAGTTSAITFTVRVGVDTVATVTFNGAGGVGKFNGTLLSTIEVKEIKA